MRYVALLRGVNVGGNNKVTMKDLVAAMTEDGFIDVKSYINSGNVLFGSSSSKNLDKKVAAAIKRHSGLDIDVVVVEAERWGKIIDEAPKAWGKQDDWKHNIVVMIPPATPQQMLQEVGELRPEYESLTIGDGVVYQSISLKYFGRARSGALVGKPLYKKMTIRNYNTATKLAQLLATA